MQDAVSELRFLNELKDLSLALSLLKSNDMIDAVKSCVIQHQNVIPDENQAVEFIEELVFISERDASHVEIDSFLRHLASFWKWSVLSRPLDFIYVGEEKNYPLIDGMLGEREFCCQCAVFIDYYDASEALDKLRNTALLRPILLCDNRGESQVDSSHYLGIINIENESALVDNYFSYISVIRKHIEMVDILNNNLQLVKESESIDKVILGSSFAYYGLPDSLLTRSSNLAISSGDSTYNKTLLEYCINRLGVNDFVIVIGFFELFHELAKGANGYFHLASTFLKENRIPYSFRDADSMREKVFLFNANKNTLVELLEIDTASWIMSRNIAALRKTVAANPQKGKSTDFSYTTLQLRRETEHFAKFYSREGVAEYNKRILQSMVELVRQSQGHIYFVIQPFTQRYNDYFHPQMRQETKDFLASIADEQSAFCIDMSEDPDFGPEDFSDAHHLNFSGAKKLYHKLEWLKL